MKRGFHWLAQLPDGQFIILYADPVLKGVHRQIAVFETEKEAISHARKSRFELLRPKAFEPDANGDARATPRQLRLKALLETVSTQLPTLYKSYEAGIGVSDIVTMYGVDYDDARYVLTSLAADGKGRWMKDRSHATARKCLLPPDTEEVTDDSLSYNQREVLKVLTKRANAEGFADLRLLELSQEAGVARGSLTYVMHELCRKGAIEIASMEIAPGRGGLATTVRVTSKVPPPNKATTVFYQKLDRERT
jgi:hypothetical protein